MRVLVVSATKDAKAREHVSSLGAAAFPAKPVSPDTFVDAVEALGPRGKT